MRITIVDGYIDEPASLGVPPFISPVARYLLGAAFFADESISAENINYLTIDDFRNGFNPGHFHPLTADIVVILSNLQVPGKYRGGTPASKRELEALVSQCGGEVFSWALPLSGARKIPDDPDLFLYEHILGHEPSLGKEAGKSREIWERFAKTGARNISHILKSASYSSDYSICEIDSFKGCPRTRGCSFCPEWRRPLFSREPGDVVEEVRELMSHGITKFRIGGSCFFSYLSKELGKKDTPEPNVEELTAFLQDLSAMKPEVLHIDNANPAVIATHTEKASQLCETIVSCCTPGNIASFGMESADPKIIQRSNINSTPEDVFTAVTILNTFGKKPGENGLPAFLPGINLLYGLPGETKESFRHNYDFLKRVYDEGLLLRRINIRQVDYGFMKGCDSGENLHKNSRKLKKKHRSAFMKYKSKIREEVDRPMLARVIPTGTVLRKVYLESLEGTISFGRQLGSYPVLVGVPYPLEPRRFYDIKVSSHGFRSVTGVAHPFHLNRVSFSQLEALPWIGKKRAARVFMGRPVRSGEQFRNILDDENVARRLLDENWVSLA